eukprot:TRINITY_DN15318_c0_g1_i6.p1 TRINITY_DN15318_c0_g1~~TRINITY_DN15318_c0_g1_i6.p1  ORF type:complete len:175 (+),score=21.35 TRINITY_DN15318_c0_g1_i6:62-586(+)
MLRSLLGSSPSSVGNASTSANDLPSATLLVIQEDNYDWPQILKNERLCDGRALKVWQAGWEDILVHCDTYSTSRLCVDIRKPAKSASGPDGGPMTAWFPKSIQPDFLLVRNEVVTPHFDCLSKLNAFLFADLPAVNSLESILMSCQRPAMQGQLNRIHKKLGEDIIAHMNNYIA